MLLREAVLDLLETYNSIDFRVAAIRIDGQWTAGYTVIRFSKQTIQELNAHYAELEKTIGYVKDANYQQILKAFPTGELQNIIDNWANHLIVFPDLQIRVYDNNEFNSEVSQPRIISTDLVNSQWPCSHISNQAHFVGLNSDLRHYNDQAILQSCDDFCDHLSKLLEIEQSEIVDQGRNIISAPIHFKMNSVSFENNSIIVYCEGDKRKVDLTIWFYEMNRNGQPGKVEKKTTIFYDGKMEDSISKYEIKENIETVNPKHFYTVNAMYKNFKADRKSGIVEYNMLKIQSSFLDVFNQFITISDLKKMVIQYESNRENDKKDILERGISYILSLLGLNSVWLGGKYDSIGIEPSKISVDILGKSQNTVLLCHVSKGTPDTSDFTRMNNSKKNLKNLIKNEDLDLKSILFSGSSLQGMQDTASQTNVTLIGKEELEEILDNIEKGNITRAKEVLFREYQSSTVGAF